MGLPREVGFEEIAIAVLQARLWTARRGTEAIQHFYCFRFGGSSHIWCVIFQAPLGSLRINVRNVPELLNFSSFPFSTTAHSTWERPRTKPMVPHPPISS